MWPIIAVAAAWVLPSAVIVVWALLDIRRVECEDEQPTPDREWAARVRPQLVSALDQMLAQERDCGCGWHGTLARLGEVALELVDAVAAGDMVRQLELLADAATLERDLERLESRPDGFTWVMGLN